MNIIRTNIQNGHEKSSRATTPSALLAKTYDIGTDPSKDVLLIIDSRALERECLALSLSSNIVDMEVVAVGSYADWTRKQVGQPPLAAVLLNIGGRHAADAAVTQDLAQLVRSVAPAPLVVLADSDDAAHVLKALECGAKGYIPTSVGINVCSEAISLAKAGGVFVPGSTLVAMRKVVELGASQAPGPVSRLFTARQGEVLDALRRGKANKTIAHELELKESTVKVHIRHIMKKLKATNRTEVVYKINDLMAQRSN